MPQTGPTVRLTFGREGQIERVQHPFYRSLPLSLVHLRRPKASDLAFWTNNSHVDSTLAKPSQLGRPWSFKLGTLPETTVVPMGDSVYFHWVQDPAVVQYEGELLEVVLENVEKPVLVERHATAAEFALKAAITADLV